MFAWAKLIGRDVTSITIAMPIAIARMECLRYIMLMFS
jgi:hypothetical protein